MKRVVAGALWLAVLAACRSTPAHMPDDLVEGPVKARGVYHPVEKGQTLWRIARAYELSLQELAEVNDLEDPAKIHVGQKLWVPRAVAVRQVEPAASLVTPAPPPTKQPTRQPAPTPVKEEPPPRVQLAKTRFIWPVDGVLYSRFGIRDGTQHDGIDISAPKGTPVVAADDGHVLYAGVQRGYGNIVLVKHADELITIYAHNEVNLVETGQRVKLGQPLAKVGQTGRATGPHLHFEVRKKRLPRNPLFFLPDPPKK